MINHVGDDCSEVKKKKEINKQTIFPQDKPSKEPNDIYTQPKYQPTMTRANPNQNQTSSLYE